MSGFSVITNNPAVVSAYPEIAMFNEVGVLDVYVIVRDMVHKGAKVLSHPLSGSVKPWETPYKSVAVSCITGVLDLDSLKCIESAIGMMKNRRMKARAYSQRVLDDFGMIDLDIINSAIYSRKCNGHGIK